MTALIFLRTIFLVFVAIVIGRLFAGVSLMWMSLFFLFLTVPLHPGLVVFLCLAIDLFFFLPFGMTLLILGAFGFVFPYVRARSVIGFVQMLIFFSLFVLIGFVLYPHVSLVALAGVVFFSFLALNSSLVSSDSVHIG
jgi:hypothetical protein